MLRALPIVILLAACASQPIAPQSTSVDACDPGLPTVGQIEGSGDVRPPRLIRKVDPQTPSFRGEHLVEIETVIDESGRVTSICEVHGDPQLIASVLTAVRQWTFEPATLNGKPVKVRFKMTTKFRN